MEYKKLPDLKGLATLRAVVELGGVNQAALALHIGQPAITKRLRALDSCYQLTLMNRDGRKLELTPAGKRVYDYARFVLDRQTSLLEDLYSLAQGQNLLRLEVTSAVGEHLLPGILLHFNDNFPQYRIESRMDYSRHIQTRLATGLSDLALLEIPPDHPEILVQKWFDDELILIGAVNHPSCHRSEIELNELSRQKYVLREAQSSTRLILDRALADVGIHHLPTSLEVGSTDTIIEMLSRGSHLSFLPRFAVQNALEKNKLQHIKVRGLRLKTTLWIARNRSNINNPVAEAFIQQLRTHSNKL